MRTLIVTTYGDNIGVVVYAHHKVGTDPVEAIRRAANDWVKKTEEGAKYYEEIDGDFNWGDALTQVPKLECYGVTIKEISRMVELNHVELLVEWELHLKEN